MKKILIVADFFPPSTKGGGLLVGIPNILSVFDFDFDFTVLTSNHDVGDDKPFDSVPTNVCINRGLDKVIYCDRSFLSGKSFRFFLSSFDGILITGLYSPMARKILTLNHRGRVSGKIVVSPMGCLDPGALSVKPIKKRLFLGYFNLLHYFDGVSWAFSSPRDQQASLRSIHNWTDKIFITTELPTLFQPLHLKKPVSADLNLVYLSRIVPKKNLFFALEVLTHIRNRTINFIVYGNIEDKDYFARCLALAATLPSNIHFSYGGFLSSVDECRKAFFNNDYFFFPTTSENYGYVILECLSSGTPPIISDQTFFSFLSEKKAGFVQKLNNMQDWITLLATIPGSATTSYSEMSRRAVAVYQSQIENARETSGYLNMLNYLVEH